MEKLKMHSPDMTPENIAKIRELFPHCVTEAHGENGEVTLRVDFDLLRQELSSVLVEGPQERYRLDWPGKRQALLTANVPIAKTLCPCREESVNFDTTKNLYIEGDNLDALKLLQESYLGKVKMIYIDPPYNTGNDFIYEDDFAEDVEEYLRKSNQKDEEGNRLTLNSEGNGRFHSDWLTMMYSRLKIARNLLCDDGVIFISCDDNEVDNLRKIGSEIFGEDNFAAQFPWRKRTAKSDVPFGISQDYEWLLCYAKSVRFIACMEGGTRKYFETEDIPGRPWRIHDLTTNRTASERPNSFFTIINPKTGTQYPANPNRTWAVTKDTFEKYYAENRIVFPGDYEFLNISKPALRYFKEDDTAKAGDKFGFIPVSTNLPSDIGMTQDGTKDFTDLFGNKSFGFPKPISLLKYFVKMTTATSSGSSDIILDFFSGSATTAHAVMQLNAEDGGNRQFIMVQLPEPCAEKSEAFKAGYSTIAEIGKERIRRAGKKILEGECNPNWNKDIGFRVLKVDSSCMEDVYYTPDQIDQKQLSLFANNIKADRRDKPEDLLYQVLIDWGVELHLPIKPETIQGKKVFFVDENALVACFDSGLEEDFIKEVARHQPLRVVFRDAGFASDAARINAEQIFKQLSPNTEVKVI